MKKIIALLLVCFGFATAGYSQAAGKGSGEKNGSSKVKPHAQMRHFERRKRDPKMRHNGTSYKKNKTYYKVDGDGFSNSPGKGRRRRKKG